MTNLQQLNAWMDEIEECISERKQFLKDNDMGWYYDTMIMRLRRARRAVQVRIYSQRQRNRNERVLKQLQRFVPFFAFVIGIRKRYNSWRVKRRSKTPSFIKSAGFVSVARMEFGGIIEHVPTSELENYFKNLKT